MLVDVPQPELISHVVMLVLCICPRSFYFRSAKRRLTVVVEGRFAVRISASLDVDGRVARTGDVVAEEAAFELALAES